MTWRSFLNCRKCAPPLLSFCMRKSASEPCISPSRNEVPARPELIHEVKHNGCKRVRLFTRNGHDFSDRYPLIAETALRNRNSSFVFDGEAVLLGVDGRSTGLHSRSNFMRSTCWWSDHEDIRKLPLSMRKTNLHRLLARRVDGIHLAPFSGRICSGMPARWGWKV
jgi:bifunctional non-homologous end joining protein LigD